MATGFSATTRRLVETAVHRSVSRSRRSGAETTVAANTSEAPTAPSVIQTGKRFEPCERITCRMKASQPVMGAVTKSATRTAETSTHAVPAIARPSPIHTRGRVPRRQASSAQAMSPGLPRSRHRLIS